MRGLGVIFLALYAILSWAPARAEHEVNHRYTVQGYVLGADEKRLRGVGVSVRAGTRFLGGATTNSDGFYRIRLHLHDSDIGRTLEVSAGDGAGSITMTATPRDRTTARIHDANFVGGELVEGKLRGMGISSAWYVAAGFAALLAVAGGVIAVLRRRARRARRVVEAQQRKSDVRKGRKGRKRRKR